MTTSLRNQGWANQNEARAFPLDDGASLLDDAGVQLPMNLVADLKVLVPDSAGKFLYIGAIAATPAIITVIIMASDDLGTPGIPVLTISQARPIERHQQYLLAAQMAGAGGWIAFGEGANDLLYRGRFSLPNQSLIAPLAGRWYRTPPIPSVSKLGSPAMTGLVSLIGGNDIEIVKECREVPGNPVPSFDTAYCGSAELGTQVREVIVFRLKDKSPTQQNVFARYVGTCGSRPENQNCGDPAPVEFIGPVAPDCCGNITFNLKGCAEISAVQELVTVDEHNDPVLTEDACGIIIDCGLGLDDACVTRDRLPDAEGNLPNEAQDLCASVSFDSVNPPADSVSTPFDFNSLSASVNSDPTLPVTDTFLVLENYVVRFGSFNYDTTLLTISASSSAGRNVVTYEPPDAIPIGFYKRASSRLQLLAGSTGSLHNAAVIANYRENIHGTFGYYAAEIDWDGHYRGYKLFRLAQFNGTNWVTLFATSVPELDLNTLYDIFLEVYPSTTPGAAWLVGRLHAADDSLDLTIGPLSVANYGPTDGPFGLGTNQAITEFLDFKIENILTPP